MARQPSKILSVAEKKTAELGLKSAIKTLDQSVKVSESDVSAANKTMAAAKKQAAAVLSAAEKANAAALKEAAKIIEAAQKVVDAATKKHTKVFDAAGKGREKLNDQLASLNAVPVEPAKRGRKPKQDVTAEFAAATI